MAKSEREPYKISCVDDILRIPDMKTARSLLKEWNLETKGMKTRDEALKKLASAWKAKEESVVKERVNAFLVAMEDEKRNRQALSKTYDEVKQLYYNLPKHHQADLDDFLSGVENNIEIRKQELKSSDCTILIAGETSAGKSSFVNLLLGTSILPTSDLRCTSTVCEIRNSSDGNKRAVLHHRSDTSEDKRSPKTIDLQDETGMFTLSKHIMEFDEETEESPYSKIEVFWPVPILPDGMVIVDTPGIGGIKHLSKCVERYLTKSFGFIYIINSASAGGIQKGRLEDFLRLVVTSVDEKFNPRATMFVCNKWDTVPEEDREDIQNTTLTKLQRCYPGVRADQMYRLSVDEALKATEYGSFVAEHKHVLKGIQNLLRASLHNQLGSHYRWLSQLLKRSMYSLKVSKLMDLKGMKDKEETQKSVQIQMEKLDKEAVYTLNDMKKKVHHETGELHKHIVELLTSADVINYLCLWKPEECPRSDSWKKLAKEAESRIAKKVSFRINTWDNENNIVKGLKNRLVDKFKNDFELMEDQMKKIESVLLPGETRTISDFQTSIKRSTTVKRIFSKAGNDQQGHSQDDSIKRLGAAVSSSGLLDPKSKEVRMIFKSYNKTNADSKMDEATVAFVRSITHGKSLKIKLDNFLGKYMKGIDDVAKVIPNILKADKQLMATLNLEVSQSQQNIRTLYPSLLHECAHQQGCLDMLHAVHIFESDYRPRDIDYKMEDLLGSGSFADVFKGTLKSSEQGETIQVALKVSKESLNKSNVSDILLEDNIMRDLQHANIVKYYGAVLSQTSKDNVKWIMVLEFCMKTLKKIFISENYENPGTMGTHSMRTKAMVEMARYAVQVCRGLQYLHSKDLVHRDLKLENVLVSVDNVVKLTDVGLAKGKQNIAGTKAGSPVYMAPEVLEAGNLYDHKADIYSLAVLLWEMWYGIDAADHIKDRLDINISFDKQVLEGLRPQMSLQHKPTDDWQTIIVRCWAEDPERRIEARVVGNFFDDFLKRM